MGPSPLGPVPRPAQQAEQLVGRRLTQAASLVPAEGDTHLPFVAPPREHWLLSPVTPPPPQRGLPGGALT